jgi:3-hydroxymyristoyl/3-hydroxydecanoyl-(acyl carrier protein) dehydratase
MALNFLGMCSPPVHTKPGSACAEIDVKHFSNWRELPMAALLTEGINQFAVRFARTVLPNVMARRQRVLPVGIRNLAQLGELGAGPFLVEGDISQFGPTARVRVTVRNMQGGAAAPCLMQAEVAAAVAGELAVLDGTAAHSDSIAPLLWDVAHDPLLRLDQPFAQLDRFGFHVSPGCPLLEEHFPGFAVAPGSLVLAFLWEQAARRLGVRAAHLRIDDARFVRPVTPGMVYSCSVRALVAEGKPERHRFVVSGPDGSVHTQGVFHFTDEQLDSPTAQQAHAGMDLRDEVAA